MQQVLANQGLVQPVVGSASSSSQNHQEAGSGGHYSDTTASAAGSDDEGSTAATDGSTLRTSPAEQVIKVTYKHIFDLNYLFYINRLAVRDPLDQKVAAVV